VVANPATLARQLRTGTGLVALGTSALLLLRGMTHFALWAGALAWWLLAGPSRLAGWSRRGQPQQGQSSRVTTDHLEVELEHDTGVIRGRVLKGFFRDRDLETLRPVELAHLWSDCQFDDPQSAQILEAYLDRIHPSWRDDMARGGSDTGASGGANMRAPQSGVMSREEAFDILGLAAGASEDDIRRAHKLLMLKLHPDRGGSHTLAAKVNQAKEVLLGKS
jgi:hypothetical protein